MIPNMKQYVVKIGPGPRPGDEQAWLRFPNGWGASVIHAPDYGGFKDYWEVMLLRWEGQDKRAVHNSPLMDHGPRQYLTPDQVVEVCQAIMNLPAPDPDSRLPYLIPVLACAVLWLIPFLLFLPAVWAVVIWLITVVAAILVLLPRIFP